MLIVTTKRFCWRKPVGRAALECRVLFYRSECERRQLCKVDELTTKNVTVCVEARNKKQEFNGAIAEIEKFECDNGLMERGEISVPSDKAQAWRDQRSKIIFGVANRVQPTIAVYDHFSENDNGQWMPAASK